MTWKLVFQKKKNIISPKNNRFSLHSTIYMYILQSIGYPLWLLELFLFPSLYVMQYVYVMYRVRVVQKKVNVKFSHLYYTRIILTSQIFYLYIFRYMAFELLKKNQQYNFFFVRGIEQKSRLIFVKYQNLQIDANQKTRNKKTMF